VLLDTEDAWFVRHSSH